MMQGNIINTQVYKAISAVVMTQEQRDFLCTFLMTREQERVVIYSADNVEGNGPRVALAFATDKAREAFILAMSGQGLDNILVPHNDVLYGIYIETSRDQGSIGTYVAPTGELAIRFGNDVVSSTFMVLLGLHNTHVTLSAESRSVYFNAELLPVQPDHTSIIITTLTNPDAVNIVTVLSNVIISAVASRLSQFEHRSAGPLLIQYAAALPAQYQEDEVLALLAQAKYKKLSEAVERADNKYQAIWGIANPVDEHEKANSNSDIPLINQIISQEKAASILLKYEEVLRDLTNYIKNTPSTNTLAGADERYLLNIIHALEALRENTPFVPTGDHVSKDPSICVIYLATSKDFSNMVTYYCKQGLECGKEFGEFIQCIIASIGERYYSEIIEPYLRLHELLTPHIHDALAAIGANQRLPYDLIKPMITQTLRNGALRLYNLLTPYMSNAPAVITTEYAIEPNQRLPHSLIQILSGGVARNIAMVPEAAGIGMVVPQIYVGKPPTAAPTAVGYLTNAPTQAGHAGAMVSANVKHDSQQSYGWPEVASAMLYEAILGFKLLDIATDSIRLVHEPTFRHAKTVLFDFYYLYGMYSKNGVYLVGVGLTDAAYQLQQGNTQQAFTVAISTLGFAALPCVVAMVNYPYVSLAYTTSVAVLVGYYAITNFCSLGSELTSFENRDGEQTLEECSGKEILTGALTVEVEAEVY